MPRYRPSELIAFLQELGIQPNKRLSQNFLIDGNILRKIVQLAQVQEGDHVLEIGPGPGALTEILLEQGAHVIAIEKDAVFAEALSKNKNERLQVYCGDILKLPLDIFFAQKLKVVANIPYHLTTPIIEHIIEYRASITSATLMMQEEVARRLLAHPHTKDFSSLSLFVQFFANLQQGFLVAPTCFYPCPKVSSMVVHLEMRTKYPHIAPEAFFQITRTAFGQRRKMLTSSLAALFDKQLIEKTLALLGKLPTTRPEELALEEWVRFFEQVKDFPQNEK
jgi:16S rRNA (adenine1518-N6/adenine1519-N6)-dimethyltransferase